jgi:small subunit ribosomal protein S6
MGINQRSAMNQYEIAVLYHPDLEVDLEKATSRVEKIFEGNGGKITARDNWGRRRLAYDIRKCESAIYVIYTVDFPPESVRKVESTLNITDEVIRFLITRPDLKAIAKAEVAKEEKARKAAERGNKADDDDDKDSDDEPRERRGRSWDRDRERSR